MRRDSLKKPQKPQKPQKSPLLFQSLTSACRHLRPPPARRVAIADLLPRAQSPQISPELAARGGSRLRNNLIAQQKSFPQRRARVEDLPIPAVGYRRTCAARVAIPVDPQAPTQRVLLGV